MQTYKRTFTIDPDILPLFEKKVKPGKRSALISSLLRRWLGEEERKRLREAIIAGLDDMKDVYLAESEAWYPLEQEVMYNYEREHSAAPRRRRSRKA